MAKNGPEATVRKEIVCSRCFSGPFSAVINGCFQKRGIPKWMVYFMENPIKMDDLGVPLFLETPK